MPNYCTIEVHFKDGRTEEYYGGLHLNSTCLKIWPVDGGCVTIPLQVIRKYITTT